MPPKKNGKRGYDQLQQFYADNDEPVLVDGKPQFKPNRPSDPDYVAPIEDASCLDVTTTTAPVTTTTLAPVFSNGDYYGPYASPLEACEGQQSGAPVAFYTSPFDGMQVDVTTVYADINRSAFVPAGLYFWSGTVYEIGAEGKLVYKEDCVQSQ